MKISLEKLSTFSLQNLAWGSSITRIISAALQAVEPENAIRNFLVREGDRIIVANEVFELARFKKVLLVGAGKASVAMSSAVFSLLGDHIEDGYVITKRGYVDKTDNRPSKLIIKEAGHPLPDQESIEGTRKIINLLEKADRTDLILCVISGGGSALLTLPAPGITLDDLKSLTTLLLASGATIDEINPLRKHLDQVKGGGLAKFAPNSHWITFILSDVVGDPLDKIASGPTIPDPTTFSDALHTLEKYELTNKAPRNVIRHIRKGMKGLIPDTSKPGDPAFPKIDNIIVGNNHLASAAAFNQARIEGFNTLILTNFLQGEAREVGKVLAGVARQLAQQNLPVQRPACIIVGGETTVTLQGNGQGGRNQEIALASAKACSGLSNTVILTLATDGGDGSTDAAGAVVTGETFARAAILGLDPDDFLKRNDSYHFFDPLGDLIRTGPTLTNVNDLLFIFVK